MKVAARPHVKWKDLTQLGPFRWNNLAPLRAARVAFGVVVPLVLGLIGGHTEYGAYAALGALPAGFASFQGETRTRVGAVLVACFGMAVSAFVGATAAEYGAMVVAIGRSRLGVRHRAGSIARPMDQRRSATMVGGTTDRCRSADGAVGCRIARRSCACRRSVSSLACHRPVVAPSRF